MSLTQLINKLHKSKILGTMFHTLDYCLTKELKDCETVLDLGCGPSSPLQHCKNIKYSVGVETFKPYIEESKRGKIHTEYIDKRIELVDFPNNSFDAVIMIEVLEHLPIDIGLNILRKAEIWAKKKIIVSTPNGYFPMDNVDGNIYQKHLSGWSQIDLQKLGFTSYGVSGAKFMYQKQNSVHSLYQTDATFSNVRFKPQKLFYLINGFLQIFVYYMPKFSFGLFAVKEKIDV